MLVKDLQRHPVRGEIMHVDFLRVNMNETIHTTVVLELLGADEAPGVVEGGVLSQETREVNIEALPGDIPDIDHARRVGDADQRHAHAVRGHRPAGITLLDDLEETVIATITPPTLEPVEDEIETETALVGEDGEAAEGEEAAGRRRRRRAPPSPPRRVLKVFSSTPVDWLIVGLGNPGPGYVETPHNVGFKVAEELRRRWDLPEPKKKFAGELSEGRTRPGGPRVAVLKPQTYMNEAGRSAGPARGSFKLDLDHVLVLHDEIDLPFGDIRVAARRRARRPQRAEVLEARAGLAGLPSRADRRRAAGLDRPGHRRRLRARPLAADLRRGRRPDLRAADEAERLIG